MKYEPMQLLKILTHPLETMSEEEYKTFLEQGDDYLRHYWCNLYRKYMPSARMECHYDIWFNHRINHTVQALITEMAIERYLSKYFTNWESTGGNYDTYEEQRQTLGKCDFRVGNKT